MVADHLYRLERPTEDEKENEIANFFPDELFFQLSVQAPWYANIVNFLAC